MVLDVPSFADSEWSEDYLPKFACVSWWQTRCCGICKEVSSRGKSRDVAEKVKNHRSAEVHRERFRVTALMARIFRSCHKKFQSCWND